MNTIALSDVQLELEHAYIHFNGELFDSELIPCMITIQKSPRGNILGWTSFDKIWRNHHPDGDRFELNVCPHIFHKEVHDILGTLLHEMVHVYNCQQGVRDCSSSQYHNRKFRDKALAVGLSVSKAGYRGWAYTDIDQDSRAERAIQGLNLKKEVFAFARGILVKDSGKPLEPEIRGKLKKWSCPCGQNARVAIKDFQAICKKCGGDFVRMK